MKDVDYCVGLLGGVCGLDYRSFFYSVNMMVIVIGNVMGVFFLILMECKVYWCFVLWVEWICMGDKGYECCLIDKVSYCVIIDFEGDVWIDWMFVLVVVE